MTDDRNQEQRAANTEARLRLAREALVADGYFTADQVGVDIAPRIVEWLSHHRGLIETFKAEVARLRAGEEPGWDPLVVPTPGQWIARWNQAPAAERLDVAKRVIGYTATASTCFEMNHVRRLEEDRQAWVSLARVRDVLADMEQITGARHWARILRKAVDGEQQAPPDQLAAALREVLAAFRAVRDDGTRTIVGYMSAPIHPDDMDRWRNVLDPPPEKPTCARCKGRGYVPDWTNWDAYHGEPKPKRCPDCQTTEDTP